MNIFTIVWLSLLLAQHSFGLATYKEREESLAKMTQIDEETITRWNKQADEGDKSALVKRNDVDKSLWGLSPKPLSDYPEWMYTEIKNADDMYKNVTHKRAIDHEACADIEWFLYQGYRMTTIYAGEGQYGEYYGTKWMPPAYCMLYPMALIPEENTSVERHYNRRFVTVAIAIEAIGWASTLVGGICTITGLSGVESKTHTEVCAAVTFIGCLTGIAGVLNRVYQIRNPITYVNGNINTGIRKAVPAAMRYLQKWGAGGRQLRIGSGNIRYATYHSREIDERDWGCGQYISTHYVDGVKVDTCANYGEKRDNPSGTLLFYHSTNKNSKSGIRYFADEGDGQSAHAITDMMAWSSSEPNSFSHCLYFREGFDVVAAANYRLT